MGIKKGYKQTEIGLLPEDWEVVRLNQNYFKGKKPPRFASEHDKEALPYLSTDYLREGKATKFTHPSKDMILVDDGDLILLWDGSNAGEFFLGKRGILSSTMVKFELSKERFNNKFLFYFLKTKEPYLKGQTRGTGIPHVDERVLRSLLVPLPPLPEQKKIAEILSTVDEGIEKVGQAIAKTERLKKGLMQKLLTKGIGHKKFKKTEIGEIPKNWEVVRLGDVLELLRNGLVFRQNKDKKGMPVTRIETISEEKIDSQKVGYIEEISEREISEYRLQIGDVLFSHINSIEHIGKTAIYNGEPPMLLHGMNLLLLRPKKALVEPNYLLCQLRHLRAKGLFRNMSKKAVNQASINQLELGRVKLICPPLPEQKKIAEILSAVDKILELLREKKERLERVKQGLMNDLLSGRKRVKASR